MGVTGQNVTVAVVDDGLEWDNPDLKANYNPAGSIDLNDHDNDPMPNELNGKLVGELESVRRTALAEKFSLHTYRTFSPYDCE